MKNNNRLILDSIIIAYSILFTLVLIKTGIIENLIIPIKELRFLGSFVAGMFYTSAFTTAPAIVVLGEIALNNSVFWTAFFGALGASTVDLIIFEFIRDRFSDDITDFLRQRKWGARLKILHNLKLLRWLTFIAAGLIIASPLPDELGISILGFSKTKTPFFLLFSFSFNFAGILAIGIIAKSLL